MPDVDSRLTKRPKFLTLVCLIALAYNGLLMIVFFFGVLMSLGLSQTLMTYAELYELSSLKILAVSLAGFVLFGISFWSILKIYLLRRLGFYIFLITGALLIILQISQGFINWYFLTVFILFSLIFSLYIKQLSVSKKVSQATDKQE
jgi:hypothetical protein